MEWNAVKANHALTLAVCVVLCLIGYSAFPLLCEYIIEISIVSLQLSTALTEVRMGCCLKQPSSETQEIHPKVPQILVKGRIM